MVDLADRLGEFGIFAELDSAELAAVAGVSRVEDFDAGATLTEEGAEAKHLYLFLKGKATVMVRYPDGDSGVLDEVSAGDELGWSAVTKPYRYTATARATEPVQAIVIDGVDLRRLAEQNHHLAYGISQGAIAIVARRYGRAIGGQQDLREKDLRAFGGEERVIWDNGEIQLTTEAVLFEAHTDSPDVVPLEAINEVTVEDGHVVLRATAGDVRSSRLDAAEELAALIWDETRRIRLPYRRVGS